MVKVETVFKNLNVLENRIVQRPHAFRKTRKIKPLGTVFEMSRHTAETTEN